MQGITQAGLTGPEPVTYVIPTAYELGEITIVAPQQELLIFAGSVGEQRVGVNSVTTEVGRAEA